MFETPTKDTCPGPKQDAFLILTICFDQWTKYSPATVIRRGWFNRSIWYWNVLTDLIVKTFINTNLW